MVLSLLVGIFIWTRYFQPWDLPPTNLENSAAEPASDTQVRFLELSTGSRIAYRHHSPENEAISSSPVIFLHGGPGLAEWPRSEAVLELNRLGLHVYGFHQFGGGLSSRAKAPHLEYTIDRQVRDLEDFRKTLNVESWILVGQSWGGALAAHYTAAFPERVQGLILTAPAPVWLPAFGMEAISSIQRLSPQTQEALRLLIQPKIPRLAFHRRLAARNPASADRLIDEEDYAAFIAAQTRLSVQSLACDPEKASGLSFPHQGGLVHRYLFADMHRIDDVRPKLRGLRVPVLLMQPECDFVDPDVVAEYEELFPLARRHLIQGAGHEIQLERPHIYRELLVDFLKSLETSP